MHEKIHDAYVAKLLEGAKKRQKIGDPLAADTTQGPQVSLEV